MLTRRPLFLILVFLILGLVVALLAQGADAADGGYVSGVALALGGLAYALMATNLLLATRSPVLERLLAPIDRLYVVHRIIGTAIVGVIGLHMIVIPIASLVDRGESILENPSPAIPLGVLGTLIVLGSVALTLRPQVPYHRWQAVHMAIVLGFVLLTFHFIVGAGQWISLASPAGVLLFLFAVTGLASIVTRAIGRGRGGQGYRITAIRPRERAVEVTMEPIGDPIGPHRPGQFVFLTASPGGHLESHPFSVTSPSGSPEVSVLIRSSGDWTKLAQTGLMVGDEVALDGPYGGFCPPVEGDTPSSQVWVAAGAGITPYLSVLRNARASNAAPNDGGRIELVYIAREPADMPCRQELADLAQNLPWLRVRPWFTGTEGRPGEDSVAQLVAASPDESEWYLCGPASLSSIFVNAIHSKSGARIHREFFQWRPSVTTESGAAPDKR